MDMETIARFGPAAIALGTFLEGETTVLLAGAGLALGVFDFWTVVLSALAGSLAGDQFFFWLGRLKGAVWLNGHPRFGAAVGKATRMMVRHRLPLLCAYRFIYGLRGAIPFAFGVSGICWRFFLLANVVTAALWSVLVTMLGMHAGRFLTDADMLARLPLFGAVAAVAFGLAVVVRRRRKSGGEPT
ncbi:DedA family protein [Desulfomicrobium salsuginis]